MAECRSCGKEIVWVRTENNKMMPCDIDAEIITEKDGERLVVLKPHWASCKDADQWRKKGEKRS
jgi:hypothetical protein